MAQLGLDPAQMKALANTMVKEAGSIEASSSTVDGKLRSTWWQGNDQKQFVGQWDGQHRKALKSAADLLRQAAKHITKEAEQQIQASDAGRH